MNLSPIHRSLVPSRQRANAREREDAVRQLTFKDLMEQPAEPPIPLDTNVQRELVGIMAAAIAAVLEKGGDGVDEGSSVQ